MISLVCEGELHHPYDMMYRMYQARDKEAKCIRWEVTQQVADQLKDHTGPFYKPHVFLSTPVVVHSEALVPIRLVLAA